MASAADKELADLTECPICSEVFKDHRILPCLHTFCLSCLLNCGKDRQPGDGMPCPLCRQQFTIPPDGLAHIQKNFFMNKLIHIRKLSTCTQGQPAGNYGFRRRVLCDKHKVSKITEELLQRLTKEKCDVIEHLAGIEDKVSKAADELTAAE